MKGQGTYLDMLNSMDKFRGQLKGKTLHEAQDVLFDLSFVTAK
jgi:NitT/TauT family transport system substrate-binding protein